MPAQSLPGQSGVYAVDWEVLLRVCRSHVRSRSILAHHRIVSETHLLGPDVQWVEVDWNLVRADVEHDSAAEYQNMRAAAQQSIDRAANYVRTIVGETRYYHDEFQKKQRACSKTSMQNINRSISRGETGMNVATGVRDFSADFVLVGATALSGGAALAAMGGGSLLKGSYKWQDTKSFSAGLFTASTELFFAVVPLKLKGMGVLKEQIGKLVLAKVKAGAEMAKSVYIDGKTIGQGAVAGALKMNDPGFMILAKEWLKGADARTRLLAVPVVTVLKFGRDQGIKQLQKAMAPKPASTQQPHVAPGIIDAAAFDGCTVEEMGICKM